MAEGVTIPSRSHQVRVTKAKFRDGIRQAGPSRWEVVVSWRDADGSFRQRSRTVNGTRRDAERVRDELRHRRRNGGLEATTPSLITPVVPPARVERAEDLVNFLQMYRFLNLKQRSLSTAAVSMRCCSSA